MCDKVCTRRQKREYSKLLEYLHSVPFEYSHPLDENRESDGIDLRYRFGYETNEDQAKVAYYLDDKDGCSVLEMMVAMSIRMDDTVDFENKPGRWFWDMIHSMKLISQTNTYFKESYVQGRLDKISVREYDPEYGYGGFFTINDNRGQDLREVELWCLAMWHLTEVTKVV